MKAIANILIALGLVCYVIAIVSKLTNAGLYDFDVKPMAGLVFGNCCLLTALVINTLKK